MRRAPLSLNGVSLGGLALALCFATGCATDIDVDPAGYRCDPGGLCPPGYRCVQDLCRSEAALCEGVTCAAPPAPRCDDAQTLVTWGGGTCDPVTGGCVYPPEERTCAQGCADAACVGEDLCAQVTCDAPPAPTCLDASTLRTFAQAGTCDAATGDCAYAPTDTPCQNGCAQGQCTGQDLCQGVVCDKPPADTCDGNERVHHAATGTCEMGTGLCAYAEMRQACADGCVDGACVGPSLTFVQVAPRIPQEVTALDLAPASSGDEVLAVGPAGFVTRWDGTGWTTLASGTSQDLNAVWLAQAGVGYVVGNGGVALKYDGAQGTLTPLSLSGVSGADLVSVHGQGTHVLVAADDGKAWRSTDGTTFSALPTPAALTVVHAAYVAGDDAERLAGLCDDGLVTQPCVAYATLSGSTWYADDYGTLSLNTPFRAVGPSHGANSAFVGLTDEVHRHTDTGSYDTTGAPSLPTGGNLLGITRDEGAATSTLFLLQGRGNTTAGRLFRHVAGSPPSRLLTLDGQRQALSRNSSGGVVVLDGTGTTQNIFRRGAITDEALELGNLDFVALDGATDRRVLINAYGDVALSLSAMATLDFFRSPATSADALGVVTTSSYALIYGKGGSWSRFTPGTGHQAGTPLGFEPRAGCANSATELYLVGAGGDIARYDGATFTAQTSGTTQDLLAVTCTGAGEAVAVGSGGAVVRLSQGTWSAVAPALGKSTALTGVYAAPTGEVFVSGDGVFAKLEGGAWTALQDLSALAHLVGVSATELYAVSGKDVVRFNGTGWTVVYTSPAELLAAKRLGQAVVFAGPGGVVVEGRE